MIPSKIIEYLNIKCCSFIYLEPFGKKNGNSWVHVKVSHGLKHLRQWGGGGVSPTVSWAHEMKGGAHPSPFAALSYPALIRKRYPFTLG